MDEAMICAGGVFCGDCYSAVFRESERCSRPVGEHAYLHVGTLETGMAAGDVKPAVLIFDRETDAFLYGEELDTSGYTGWERLDALLQQQQIDMVIEHFCNSAHK